MSLALGTCRAKGCYQGATVLVAFLDATLAAALVRIDNICGPTRKRLILDMIWAA